MAEINLLQREQVSTEQSGDISRLVSKYLGIILVLVVLGYVGLLLFTMSSSKTLKAMQAEYQQSQNSAVNSDKRNEVVTRQEQLDQFERIVDKHVYWSNLLPELARVTLKSAKYTEINAESNGRLELIATLPNYGEIEKFMQIFDLPEYNQQFSNVKVLGITNVQADNSLQTQVHLELMFNPNYLKGSK